MAIKNNQKLEQKEQNKSEATSKQRASERQERINNIPPLEQRSATPKQDALNEALANVAANTAMDIAGGDNPTLATLMQQYADRADRQYGAPRQAIRPGSIDPDIDTIYRVGGSDPYTSEGYFTQSQLNNAMSGPDANAIYAATHDQQQIADYNEPYWQDYLADLIDMGLKQNYAQQRPDIPLYQNGAYVTGADAFVGRNGRVLNPGQGSSMGIPTWMLR